MHVWKPGNRLQEVVSCKTSQNPDFMVQFIVIRSSVAKSNQFSYFDDQINQNIFLIMDVKKHV